MLLAFTTLTGWAQEIKMDEPSISDYLPLLKAKGYIAYSFDTKDFKDAMVEPIVMEYAKGREPKEVTELLGSQVRFGKGFAIHIFEVMVGKRHCHLEFDSKTLAWYLAA